MDPLRMIGCVVLFVVTGDLAALDPQQPVSIGTGLLVGVADTAGAVVAFMGIPYAAPPVGALRWREPQPPLAWEGVRRADTYGPACPQPRRAQPDGGTYDEDCLRLNVWAPTAPSATGHPVLVFIHGGADQWGSGSGADCDGTNLARRGVIVVTLNFRLGIIGGFAHPALTAESPHGASGNYGLLDVIAALRWVRASIAAFGGDVGRVTIAGHSSGAHLVHCLTVSPLARGLFHRAIAMSFPQRHLMTRLFIGDLQKREQHGVRFAAMRGAASLVDLRRLSPVALLGDDRGGMEAGLHLVGVIMDGWSMPERYMPAWEQGAANDVPTMTGLTADDFGCLASHATTTRASFAALMRSRFGDRADEILTLHPAATDAEARRQDKALQNEKGMADIFHWAAWRSRASRTPVWTWFFTQAMPRPDQPGAGAFHGVDLIYAFDNLGQRDLAWTEDDRRTAAVVSGYWLRFIATGDPAGGDLPAWKPWCADDPTTMVLGPSPGPRVITTPERMAIYRAVLER